MITRPSASLGPPRGLHAARIRQAQTGPQDCSVSGLILQDEVKRGSHCVEPKAPLTGGGEAPARGPAFFTHTTTGARWERWYIAILLGLNCALVVGVAYGQSPAGVCGPSQLGSPCGEGGPAILPLAGGPGLAVGNPVHVATGGKYQRDVDMPALPGVLGLELVRHYNSRDPRRGPWGVGWVASYDTRLFRLGALVQIVQADGSRIDFTTVNAAEGACAPLDPAHGELRQNRSDGGYTWYWRNGRQLSFDAHGWLIAIVAPAGQRLEIRRSGGGHPERGRILSVRDPAGRELLWRYDARSRVVSIATPAGVVAYQYTDSTPRLAAATYPDGHWRGYLYEAAHQGGAAHRLTGIVAGTPGGGMRRLAHWRYDARGRVVATGPGAPGEPGLRLTYGAAASSVGETAASLVTVTDAAGRSTQMQAGIAGGRHVLLETTGAACPGCAAPGLSTTYDAWGRPDSVGGLPVVRDALGRITELAAGEVRVSWWRDTALPAAIEAPSVVAGRSRKVEFSWQETQQDDGAALVAPRRIREAGWRPVGSGVHATAETVAESIVRIFDLKWEATPAGLTLAGVEVDAAPPGPAPAPGAGTAWPQLEVVMDDFGRLVQWSSKPTGTESQGLDNLGRLAWRRFANGGEWRYAYDEQHRPVGVTARAPDMPEMQVHIAYAGRVIEIANGDESETRGHDAYGRLVSRVVRRTSGATAAPGREAGRARWSYGERFAYDAQGRLVWHWLPEGGALRYQWGRGRRLRGVDWIDSAGRRSVLIRSEAGDGYRYGNGVRLRGVRRAGRLSALAHLADGQPLWAQALTYDADGRILSERVRHRDGRIRVTQLAYDAAARLVAAEANLVLPDDSAGTLRDAPDAQFPVWRSWRAWNDDGALLRARRWQADGSVAPGAERAEVAHDASGLPRRIGARQLEYGADRRLRAVYENGARLASYRHNAHGERIYREDAAGASHYLYTGRRLVAEWRGHGGTGGVTRRYVYAQGVPVAMIVYAEPQPMLPPPGPLWLRHLAGAVASAPRARVYGIHADALGAPRALTDEVGQVVWRAAYTPWGQVEMDTKHLDPGLRLPGQMADPATGWYDNYLRTYDPDTGHYLEPDPLGPAGPAISAAARGWVPHTSPYGYAAQQPLRYADPLGLVLFAFDGTREDLITATNVSQLVLLYEHAADAARGLTEVHYQPGPGQPDRLTLDAAIASSGTRIVAAQWAALLRHLTGYQASPEAAVIDLIGYSRGAALARHFGNQVAGAMRHGRFWHWEAGLGAMTACADLRFMGLFDSVAQFGLLGSTNDIYDFSIAPDWSAVAHAVALHERRGLFPLLSAAATDGVLPNNVIELPFVGAHGDIGGGLAEAGADEESHDLSDVALNWMAGQARRAGVTLARLPAAKEFVSDPALHDLRSRSQRLAEYFNDVRGWHAPDWPPSDRAVVAADGARLAEYQAEHAHYGRVQRDEAEAFIHRIEGWLDSAEPVVGVIDMPAYEAWLAARE